MTNFKQNCVPIFAESGLKEDSSNELFSEES
jgi:hypothetical protein